MVYRVSSKTTRATQRKPVSKQTKAKNQKRERERERERDSAAFRVFSVTALRTEEPPFKLPKTRVATLTSLKVPIKPCLQHKLLPPFCPFAPRACSAHGCHKRALDSLEPITKIGELPGG